MALSDKQFKFVAEYMASGNATQAAIAAGYSKQSASMQGSRLLTHVDVAREIAKHQQRVAESVAAKAKVVGITKERWLEEVAALGMSSITDMMTEGPDGKLTMKLSDIKERGMGRLIKKIRVMPNGKIEYELHPKLPALELLAKHFGWVKDQVELSGEVATSSPGLTKDEMAQLFSDPEAMELARALALKMSKPEPVGSGG